MTSVVRYNPDEFFRTTTHSLVSKKAVLSGIKNIKVGGNSIIAHGVVVRGELAKVQLGRFCLVRDNVVLHPAYKPFKG